MTFEEFVNYANDKKAEVQSQIAEVELLNQAYIKMIKDIVVSLLAFDEKVQSVKIKKLVRERGYKDKFRIAPVINFKTPMSDLDIPYLLDLPFKSLSNLNPNLKDVKRLVDKIPALHAEFKKIEEGGYDYYSCVGHKYLSIEFSSR